MFFDFTTGCDRKCADKVQVPWNVGELRAEDVLEGRARFPGNWRTAEEKV